MDEPTKDGLMVFGGFIIVILVLVFSLVFGFDFLEENRARRCAEYGYECKENQPRNDASVNAS